MLIHVRAPDCAACLPVADQMLHVAAALDVVLTQAVDKDPSAPRRLVFLDDQVTTIVVGTACE